jgi:precorrin-6Y C5,15-methyltransferase (decarboxylating)
MMRTSGSRFNIEEWRPPLVLLVGMGTGVADLSAAALRCIRRAEVLFGGKRHLESFPEHAGRRIPLGKSLDELLAEVDAVSRRSRTAVLASGDPLFYGIGRRLIRSLGRDRVRVIPGVTTVQTLCARAGIPWDDVRVFSLHGRGEGENEWLSSVRRDVSVALFTDQHRSPDWIARRLIEAGLDRCRMVIGEDLGQETEMVREVSPREALEGRFSPLNLCMVLPAEADRLDDGRPFESDLESAPVLGIEESLFAHEAGLITKLEVRAVVLAKLQLRAGHVLWDIGAGSGSVSIEASRLAALKRVVAIERNVDRHRQLLENTRKLGGSPLEVLSGNAAELLGNLSEPDRVFIGGSGGDLREILEQVAAKLRPGGRVVQTAVTLDTFEEGRSFWRERGWKLDLVQLQVSRAVPIGRSQRLEALNPVFVVTAVHPLDRYKEES